jgi:hypothetical protein
MKNEIGACSTYVGEEGFDRILMGRPEGRRPLARPRRRWKDNIKMDLQEVGWRGMGWIDLAQDRDGGVGSCECGNEPSGYIKFGKFLDYLRTC